MACDPNLANYPRGLENSWKVVAHHETFSFGVPYCAFVRGSGLSGSSEATDSANLLSRSHLIRYKLGSTIAVSPRSLPQP